MFMLQNLNKRSMEMKKCGDFIHHFSTHFSLYDHFFRIEIYIDQLNANSQKLENENLYRYDIEKVAMMVWTKYEYNSQQY